MSGPAAKLLQVNAGHAGHALLPGCSCLRPQHSLKCCAAAPPTMPRSRPLPTSGKSFRLCANAFVTYFSSQAPSGR